MTARGRPRKYATAEDAAEANRDKTRARMRAIRETPERIDGRPQCCKDCETAGIVYESGKHVFRKAKRRLTTCPQHKQWRSFRREQLAAENRKFSDTEASKVAALLADNPKGNSIRDLSRDQDKPPKLKTRMHPEVLGSRTTIIRI